MIKFFSLLFLLNINFSFKELNNEIIIGAERIDSYIHLIKDKSIGLLVNHTSTIKDIHLIDTLLDLNLNINKIYTPEHGFSGTIERGKLVKEDTL